MEILNSEKSLLNPLDRTAEILFGLIMALSFTCSISIANIKQTEMRQLLVGAIGCNLAWGLVDATMYIIGVMARKNRSKLIFESVQKLPDKDKARKYIYEALPVEISEAIGTEGLEHIREKLIDVSSPVTPARLTPADIQKAAGLFSLIFISTLPVVIPFMLINNTRLALRVSNVVAITMMFFCGLSVAKYVGFNKWIMSIAMVAIGIILVAVTIALGG